MTDIEREAAEWVSEFANQLPGSFDHAEGVKCYLAGAKSRDDEVRELREALEIVKVNTLWDPPLYLSDAEQNDKMYATHAELHSCARAVLEKWK